jgi:uncharacterized OsmC-like protein
MLEYEVTAVRQDAHGSLAGCKQAEIILDTDLGGRMDAFNPAELFLAAIAACILKGIERVAPIIHFDFRGLRVRVHGVRQDSPPKMVLVEYEIEVDTDESDARLDPLHLGRSPAGWIGTMVYPWKAFPATARIFQTIRSIAMKKMLSTLAATLVLVSLGIGVAEARGPWTATKGNTWGWQLMTPEERTEHQAKMRSFKTYDECKAYQEEHHKQMEERAKEKGLTLPMGKPGAYGCDNMRARGYIK